MSGKTKAGRPRNFDPVALCAHHAAGLERGLNGRETADEGYAVGHHERIDGEFRIAGEVLSGEALERRVREARQAVREAIPEIVWQGDVTFNGRPLPLPFVAAAAMPGNAGRPVRHT